MRMKFLHAVQRDRDICGVFVAEKITGQPMPHHFHVVPEEAIRHRLTGVWPADLDFTPWQDNVVPMEELAEALADCSDARNRAALRQRAEFKIIDGGLAPQ